MRDAGGLVTFVAVGANLPGVGGDAPLATCRAAVVAIDGICGQRVTAVSGWWRTAAEPVGGPDYVNGVVRLVGPAVDPAVLLAALLAIEAVFGRERSVANAPRRLDLDLVDLGGVVRLGPDPVLPHPRAHLRRFVLVPLLEVGSDWRHPTLGLGAAALLGQLPQGPAPVRIAG